MRKAANEPPSKATRRSSLCSRTVRADVSSADFGNERFPHRERRHPCRRHCVGGRLPAGIPALAVAIVGCGELLARSSRVKRPVLVAAGTWCIVLFGLNVWAIAHVVAR